ncbi:FAD-dependent oxidoreductase [Flaviflagellibacter deserti]|uniref:FAD-dependent oxidoreductase n=1 Tax=Flaviflagellibacter deserti TaxID=2267266 RepID=A0ABV9Z5X5_9HYPH
MSSTVAIIGAGPIGLAAAAYLVKRGLKPVILEQGPSVGSSLRSWSHVRVFTPWSLNIDGAARELLMQRGWEEPEPDDLPTGADLVDRYLEPLARHPAIAEGLLLNAKVIAVARTDTDKLGDRRKGTSFTVRWVDGEGCQNDVKAKAVIDASGTWGHPNPMGRNGLSILGEDELGDSILYGIPDIAGKLADEFAGKRTLVVGGGHSAINAVLDLVRLKDRDPATEVLWGLRRSGVDRLVGGGLNDALPGRGSLGLAAQREIDAGQVTLLAPFVAGSVSRKDGAVHVSASSPGGRTPLVVDRIVVATGSRPDFGFLRELRISIDAAVEAPPALAPLIDPNVHSCGTVSPHGAVELAHPESDFYIVGSKSYGRAPTFLMATGYEQVRSVVAEIAGDHIAAREVRLILPETGVCGSTASAKASSGCCAPPPPAERAVGACCGVTASTEEPTSA